MKVLAKFVHKVWGIVLLSSKPTKMMQQTTREAFSVNRCCIIFHLANDFDRLTTSIDTQLAHSLVRISSIRAHCPTSHTLGHTVNYRQF